MSVYILACALALCWWTVDFVFTGLLRLMLFWFVTCLLFILICVLWFWLFAVRFGLLLGCLGVFVYWCFWCLICDFGCFGFMVFCTSVLLWFVVFCVCVVPCCLFD